MLKTSQHQLPRQPENQGNRFFAALVVSQEKARDTTPAQELHVHLRNLQSAALAGDIQQWQGEIQWLEGVKSQLELAELKELEIEVHVQKWEMTLLLKASENALNQAEEEAAAANAAEERGDTQAVREHRGRAQRVTRLGQQLQAKLLGKLS